MGEVKDGDFLVNLSTDLKKEILQGLVAYVLDGLKEDGQKDILQSVFTSPGKRRSRNCSHDSDEAGRKAIYRGSVSRRTANEEYRRKGCEMVSMRGRRYTGNGISGNTKEGWI